MRPKAPEERTGPEEANQLEEGELPQEGELNLDEFTEIYESEGEAEPESLEEAGVISQELSREEEEAPLSEPKVGSDSRRSLKTSKQESRQEAAVVKEEAIIDEQSFDTSIEVFSKELIAQIESNAEQLGLNKEEISNTIFLIVKDVQDRCGPSASKEETTNVLAQRLMEEKEKLSPEAYKVVSEIIARHFSIDLGSLEKIQGKLRNVEQKKEARESFSQEQHVLGRKRSTPIDRESWLSAKKQSIDKELEEEQIEEIEKKRDFETEIQNKQRKAVKETDNAQRGINKKEQRGKKLSREIQREERKEEDQREDKIDPSPSS
jgi:hypothetical protein